MTITRSTIGALIGGSADDAEWRRRRGPLLDHFLTTSLLKVPSDDLRLLPSRGRVSINMADVVFENINASTVSIDLAPSNADAAEAWNECREFAFDFSGLLKVWNSVYADTVGPIGSDLTSCTRDLLRISDEDLRAAAILFAIRREAVELVRSQMTFREFSRGSCS